MDIIDLDQVLVDLERTLIEKALSEHRTKASAAKALTIKRTTLIEKMRRLGMPLKYLRPRENKSESPVS